MCTGERSVKITCFSLQSFACGALSMITTQISKKAVIQMIDDKSVLILCIYLSGIVLLS